ncbi:hypothetical protein [Halioglobus sp. HI00S01]|uniref:hypothetical protein n=1 Tax=Halioglobus sp. HI00S01 TaxID=1822214 RepID=UPI0012E773DE|nr:hypothetical protein [Halioglobus sp. HI00S01]
MTDRYPLGYAGRVRMLDKVFGEERVRVYRYQRDDFPDGDVVQHFMGEVGEKFSYENAGRDNTSLSLPAVQLLYAYKKQYPHPQQEDLAVVARLSELTGNPLKFHSSLFQELSTAKESGIRAFEERAGFSICEDIEADDDYGIRDERDLLSIPDFALQWLDENMNQGVLARFGIRRPKSIADKVRLLA